MSNSIIRLDDDSFLNLEHVIEIEFFTAEQFEQNGRYTWDFDEIDDTQPWNSVSTQLVADVTFNFSVSNDLYSGKEFIPHSRRFYGKRAEAIQKALTQ